ncbi:MAG: tetratricopeptide repeat protein [Candidatus Obscuribacterales bacterium]
MENITEKPHSNHRPIIRYLDEGRQLKVNIRIAEGIFILEAYLISPRIAAHKVSTHLIGCPSSGKLEELEKALQFLKQARVHATHSGVVVSPKLLGGSLIEEAIKQLINACQKGEDEKAIKLLKEHSLPKDLKDEQGNPLMCWMAQNEMVATLTCALDKEWNPNLPNTSGIYPLHYAAMKSAVLTKALLKASANPFVQTPKGSTPCGVAKSKGKFEILTQLMLSLKNNSSLSWKSFEKSYQDLRNRLEQLDLKGQLILAEAALLLGDREVLGILYNRGLLSELMIRLAQTYPFAKQEILAVERSFSFLSNSGDTNIKKENNSSLLNTQEKLSDPEFLFRGFHLFKNGKYKPALQILIKSLDMPILKNNIKMRAECCSFVGTAYDKLGEYRKAIEYHKMGLQVACELKDPVAEGQACCNLGNAYYGLGKYRKAIKYYEQDLQIARNFEYKAEQGRAYGNIGNVYQSLGDHKKAIKKYEKARHIFLKLQNLAGEGATYGNLGNAYQSLGQHRKAREYYEKRLEIALKLEDLEGEETAYNNLGVAYNSLGQYRTAIKFHQKALQFAIKHENHVGEGAAYRNLGNAYQSLSEYRKAMKCHEKSLQTAQKLDDPDGEMQAYNDLGNTYSALGQIKKAIEHYDKSLQIARKIENPDGQGQAYNNLGSAYADLGEDKKALEAYFEKALQLATQTENREGKRNAYVNIGNAYRHLRDYRKAIEYHEKSLQIAREIENPAGEASAYGGLGNIYRCLGEYWKAIEYYKKTLEIAQKLENLSLEESAYTNLAAAYILLQDLPASEENARKAIRISTNIQGSLGEDSWKITILEEHSKAHFLLLKALLEQGKEVEALSVADFGRSRALFDLLNGRVKRVLNAQLVPFPEFQKMDAPLVEDTGGCFAPKIESRTLHSITNSLDQMLTEKEIVQMVNDQKTTAVFYFSDWMEKGALHAWVVDAKKGISGFVV